MTKTKEWSRGRKHEKPKYRNPVARQLHEDRAFKLKVRSDKRVPFVKEVSVKEATILMEEEKDNYED